MTAAVECVAEFGPTPWTPPHVRPLVAWHAVHGDVPYETDFVPVRCGGGISLPGHREVREPTCGDCVAGRLTLPLAEPVVDAFANFTGGDR